MFGNGKLLGHTPPPLLPLKGMCHGSLVHFVYIANYTSLSAVELNISE